MSVPVVQARDVRVEFDGHQALNHVDLRVDEGHTVALLGANGSGKSTLVRAIVGLTPLDNGSIELFGQPLRAFRDWSRIGYVPQRTTATGGVPATVREVVASGRLARRRPFVPARRADRDAVDRAIELVGLLDRADASVDTLSGGQQQRVLIARAAAVEPDLLILDEPNAGVDQRSQEAFARALRTFVAAGNAILVVLHETGPLAPLIDRAVVLDAGTVAYDGPYAGHARTAPGDHYHHVADEQAGMFG